MALQAERHAALTQHIHERAKAAGLSLDTYDPDFLLGTIEDFLRTNNLCITPKGIRKLRKGSRHNYA